VINNDINKLKARDYAKDYLRYLAKVMSELDIVQISDFMDALDNARMKGRRIFIAGNGGSAATATHLANDLAMVSIKTGQRAFKVMALTDNSAIMTAIANDLDYDDIFVEQLKINYEKEDLLIVISASGNSPNVIKAAQWVKDNSGQVLGLLGFDGGRLRNICDIMVLVNTPTGEYGPVEDIHLVINHLLANWFQGRENRI